MDVPQKPEARRRRSGGWSGREGATASGAEVDALRTEAARVPASSYLSRSWLSCSDTTAFSRRRSQGPFLCNPLLQTPGDPRSTMGAALPSPQPAMSYKGTEAPRRPSVGSQSPAVEEGGVADPTLRSDPNPPLRERLTPPRLHTVPYGSRAARRGDLGGSRRHVTPEGCAQA